MPVFAETFPARPNSTYAPKPLEWLLACAYWATVLELPLLKRPIIKFGYENAHKHSYDIIERPKRTFTVLADTQNRPGKDT